MPEQEMLGQPHRQPAFWRLLGLFDRQARPQGLDPRAMGTDDGAASVEAYQALFRLGRERHRRYQVFEEMDTFGLVQSVLNTYAEECTQPDYDTGKSVWLDSVNDKLRGEGERCLLNLQMEDKVTPFTRRIGKYGDGMQRLLYGTGKGVLGWRPASAAKVSRVEDKYGRLVGFSETEQTYRGNSRKVSWPWDYVHGRLLGGKYEEDGYGFGLCEQMFRPWRQLTLGIDAMLMYRLRRMPERAMVQVNVGNMEEHEASEFTNTWRKRFRKHEFVDPANANYQKQYNPLTPLEDIFIPFFTNQEHRVDSLPGGGQVGEIYDIDFMVNEFFGSVGAPKAYFGFEGEINAKATLMQQDIRWARGCKRLRKATVYAIRQAVDIHLTLVDTQYDLTKKENAYVVQMSPISYLDEFERLELMELRYRIVEQVGRLAGDMQLDPRVWASYILLNFAKLPEDLVLKLIAKVPNGEGGGGAGFESLSAEQKRQVLDSDGQQFRGFTEFGKEEMRAMNEAVESSPALKRIIGRFAWLNEGDSQHHSELGQLQTDPSLLPVFTGTVRDSLDETDDAKVLRADLAALKNNTPLLTEEEVASRLSNNQPLMEETDENPDAAESGGHEAAD